METFYDQLSAEVFLLAGCQGDLLLFRVTLGEAVPMAVFPGGHQGIVRSALCLPGGRVLTAGEDGRVAAWTEAAGDLEAANFGLEPTATWPREVSTQRAKGFRSSLTPEVYGALRASAARTSPY